MLYAREIWSLKTVMLVLVEIVIAAGKYTTKALLNLLWNFFQILHTVVIVVVVAWFTDNLRAN